MRLLLGIWMFGAGVILVILWYRREQVLANVERDGWGQFWFGTIMFMVSWPTVLVVYVYKLIRKLLR